MSTQPTNPGDLPDPFEAIDAMLEDAAARIAEHVDSVVIICTFPRPANDSLGPRTGLVAAARGNYYAQQGSVVQWLKGNPEFEQPAPPKADDDGEEWKGADV